jgi:hypothetical protein
MGGGAAICFPIALRRTRSTLACSERVDLYVIPNQQSRAVAWGSQNDTDFGDEKIWVMLRACPRTAMSEGDEGSPSIQSLVRPRGSSTNARPARTAPPTEPPSRMRDQNDSHWRAAFSQILHLRPQRFEQERMEATEEEEGRRIWERGSKWRFALGGDACPMPRSKG